MLAVASVLEADPRVPLLVATPFCSGMSRTSGPCGAVTGGVIGIGIGLGRDTTVTSVEPSYDATRRFVEAFASRFGSRECTQLTGCDLSTPEGRAAYPHSDARQRCSEYVRWASECASALALGLDGPDAEVEEEA